MTVQNAPSTQGAFWGPVIAGYCGLLVAIGMGRFGFPPLIPAMVEAGWATPTTLNLSAAFNLAGYMAGALASIKATRLLGVRALIILASIASVSAFAFSAIPLPSPVFIALRTLSGVTGGLMMIVIPPVVASTVAPTRRGIAGGLTFAGVGTGFMLSGTVVPLFAAQGPAAAWLACTAIIAAAAIALVLTLPRTPPPEPARAAAQAASSWRTSPAFIGLAAAYSAAAAGYVPHTTIFVDHIARDLGYGLVVGGWIWILAGCTAVVAPMVAGLAADRFGFALSLRVVVALMALGAAIPVLTSQIVLLGLSAMLTGGLMIGLGSLAAGRTREIVGAGAHTPAWALQTVVFAAMQAGGAYCFTAVLAATGSHALVFGLASAIMVAGLVLELVTARTT